MLLLPPSNSWLPNLLIQWRFSWSVSLNFLNHEWQNEIQVLSMVKDLLQLVGKWFRYLQYQTTSLNPSTHYPTMRGCAKIFNNSINEGKGKVMICNVCQFLRCKCKYSHLTTNMMSPNVELQWDMYNKFWRNCESQLRPTTVRSLQ